MPTIYLTHVDPAQNMARFYKMSLQATLFGEWSLVREWGRIGHAGQVKANVFPAVDAAEKALRDIERSKIKRGYVQPH